MGSDEIEAGGAPEPAGTAPRPGRRVLKRILAGLGIALLALIALAGLLFGLGTMQTPSAEVRAAYEQQVREGKAAPIASRAGIPIPGCVCHSDDPAVQMRHSTTHIRECSGCHSR